MFDSCKLTPYNMHQNFLSDTSVQRHSPLGAGINSLQL